MARESAHEPSGLALRGFAVPQGVLGKIGGWLMARGNMPAQHEVAELLDLRAGEQVLEVGNGPGTLLRLLAERSEASVIAGIDPSPAMRDQALRRCSDLTTTGRVTLGLGTAAATSYPDEAFDHVVSVNNVLFWENLDTGLRELRRVLRPGGSLVVAFHSRWSPVRHERRIGLPEDEATRIETAMTEHFDKVKRRELTHVVAFTAICPPQRGEPTAR